MNPFSKKGLGRGLSSLIGDLPSNKKMSNKVLIGNLKPNKNQPRKKFDEESLKELTESIKEKGIILRSTEEGYKIKNMLRLTIGSKIDNINFMKSVKNIFNK